MTRWLPLAVCLCVLVACSVPGSVRPTLKIGLVAPFEGRYRYVGYDAIYAVRLVLDEVNQKGGVAGHGVELVAYDDGAVPSIAVEQVQKLTVDPDVMGVIGHFREDTTAAGVDLYAQARLPLVAPTALDGALTRDGSWVHQLSPPHTVVAGALLDRAGALRSAGKVLLVTGGGGLGSALYQEAQDRSFPVLTAPGYEGSLPLDLAARDVEVLVVSLDPVGAAELVSRLRDGGWAGRVLGGPALADGDFVAVAGEAAEGVEFITPWPFPRDLPVAEGFVRGYVEMSGGAQPGPYALAAHDAAVLLLEAVERTATTGRLTRTAVSSSLSSAWEEATLDQLFHEGRLVTGLTLHWYRIDADGSPHPVRPE